MRWPSLSARTIRIATTLPPHEALDALERSLVPRLIEQPARQDDFDRAVERSFGPRWVVSRDAEDALSFSVQLPLTGDTAALRASARATVVATGYGSDVTVSLRPLSARGLALFAMAALVCGVVTVSSILEGSLEGLFIGAVWLVPLSGIALTLGLGGRRIERTCRTALPCAAPTVGPFR